ncbi:MAG TPA: MFS transporter [Tepidisphaeraceae bacterium]|nr:MFS transporter [Tepidisphaeraceae bacterium]
MEKSERDEPAYEQPDPERAATSTPTESQLMREGPAVPALDHSPPPPRHDPYAALRIPNYRRFSLGWMISVVGHHMLSTAVGWEIYDRTESELALGWVAGIQVVPLLLLALPAGHWADLFDRRRLIAISAAGAALCSLGLAMLSYQPDSIPWMYALLLANAAFLVIGRPARSSLLPLIVPPHAFANAVTWNSSFFQLATSFGPAMAGFTVSWSLNSFGSARAAYLIDAACAAAFAFFIFTVNIRPVDRSDTTADRSLLAGVRFIWRTRILFATMLLDLLAVLLGGAVWLLPVYARDVLQVGPSGLGWLRAADPIGALVMTLIIAHLPPMRRAGRNMLLAVALFGAATIVFGLSKNVWLSFAMLVVAGAMDAVSVIVRHTLVQVLTPDAMRGRVSAVNNISIGASNELGGLESGVVASLLGPVAAVVLGGIGTIATVAAVAGFSPQLRKFGRLVEEPQIKA